MRIGIEGQRIFRKKKTWYGHGCIRAIKNLQIIDQENQYFIL
jgi:hypothetical protein